MNSYAYTKKSDLKICSFKEMTEEWLEFAVNCEEVRSMNLISWMVLWQTIRFGIM